MLLPGVDADYLARVGIVVVPDDCLQQFEVLAQHLCEVVGGADMRDRRHHLEEAEIHLENARNLFKQTAPPLCCSR